jgi:hypothetical protein
MSILKRRKLKLRKIKLPAQYHRLTNNNTCIWTQVGLTSKPGIFPHDHRERWGLVFFMEALTWGAVSQGRKIKKRQVLQTATVLPTTLTSWEVADVTSVAGAFKIQRSR